ncbi:MULTISPECIES: YybH family protein [unclassified Micromonospora]|uniref:YybH family protein n=1 Tax=unclassified Micromonospora TaxID=2617518 RepID=UPI002DD9214B|nr:nuclear transport factor 2 family protein [Micromonospora sp. NBC_01813]WSA08951.1 nuclear transport factor 2 family protein [Micromonospora sp. NBC_01813]
MPATPTRSAVDTPAQMLDALRERDLDGVLDCFDPGPQTYVFLEGPRWSNRGGDRVHEGWRRYFDSPVRLIEWRWADGPDVHESQHVAFVCGIVDCHFTGGPQDRQLRMRMTWGLRRGTDGVWRIIHEHGSQPLADPYGTGDWFAEAGSGQPA